MDGVTFLRALQSSGVADPPSVIVLSGQGNMDDVIEVMRLGAVDYLRKPWNLTELMSAVTRGIDLRRKPHVPVVESRAVTGVAAATVDAMRAARFADLPDKLRRGEILLPATPSVLIALRELLANPDSTLDAVATAVETDPRVAADILRVANSVAYTRLGRTTSVKAAVTRLGMRHVHNLAQTLFLEGFSHVREGHCATMIRSIWRRSVARAVSMRAVCDILDPAHALDGDTGYLIGLMADIGASLLLWVVSERSQGNLTPDDVRDANAVLNVVRASHQQLAAALLDSWKFEKVVGATVSRHHLDSPPVTDQLWWSLSVLGDDLASKLVKEDDVTVVRPRERVVVERCAAEFQLPSQVLQRLLDQLRDEFEAIQGDGA
jgi:HD-like signal output (HDOD) protein